jgi:hypothetical protein
MSRQVGHPHLDANFFKTSVFFEAVFVQRDFKSMQILFKIGIKGGGGKWIRDVLF